ncbi:MAG: hypothetical protein OEW19_12325 [Acidobacteriota bacterium]|nr:hypothetical protein [Acidobacteriota bacterium]
MPAPLTYVVVVLVVLGTVLWVAELRWSRATGAMRGRLAAGARPPSVSVYHERELDGLPDPVARYFRAVLKDGQRIITHARVTWSGEFNMGRPGADKWAAFTAVQDFVPGAPGMVWDARIRMAPGVAVRVRDGFVDGAGSMLGAVLALATVVDKHGTPEMARGSLQRCMAEAAWLPTALLPSQGVTWSPIDETRALATLRAGEVTASVEFRFGEDGLMTSMFVPDRLYDDGKSTPAHYP